MRATILACARQRGLVLREVLPADLPAVERLARSSFPAPRGWAERPENLARYRPGYPRITPQGVLNVIAAGTARHRLAGHAYFQWRPNGDVYLCELAARPPDPADRVRLAGTLLLGFLIGASLEQGCRGLATLNVQAAHRGGADGGADPVPFYERLGYVVQPAAAGGYTVSGKPRRPGDVWMAAELGRVRQQVLAYLSREGFVL
jgi:hypothetical protein